ncbi:MAG: protein kinase domain-containing protein [Chitinophagales bacterium]
MIICPYCSTENADDRMECYECFRKLNDDTPAINNNEEEEHRSSYGGKHRYEKEKERDTPARRHSSRPQGGFNFSINIDDILSKALVEKYKSKCLNCQRRLAETDVICASCGYDSRKGKIEVKPKQQQAPKEIRKQPYVAPPKQEEKPPIHQPVPQEPYRSQRTADYVLLSDNTFKATPRKIAIHADKTEVRTAKNQYHIIEIIGTGGFSRIYKVQNQRYEIFALKLLNLWQLEAYMYDEFRERFNREHQIGLAKHNNLVTHIEKGFIEGNPFSIMEFCEDGDLRTKIKSGQKWSELEATELALQILNALSILHSQQIYHRDLKPANVLFHKGGNLVLSDFGIAGFVNGRSTVLQADGKVSHLVGTREYMAPEQTDFAKSFYSLGPTTDIFSFGVLMYELFSNGNQPYGSANSSNFNNRRAEGKFVPLKYYRNDISKAWQNIIDKCLQSNEKERYQNVQLIVEELEQIRKQAYRNSGVFRQQNEHVAQKAAYLKTLVGDDKGKTFDLEALLLKKNMVRLTIGWANAQKPFENDIAILEKFTQHISSYHATIEYIEGKWHLVDGQWRNKKGQYGWYPSTNGVFVNNQKIGSGKYCLKANDIITIGKVQLQYGVKMPVDDSLKTEVWGG